MIYSRNYKNTFSTKLLSMAVCREVYIGSDDEPKSYENSKALKLKYYNQFLIALGLA